MRAGEAYGSPSSADSFMPVAGHRAFNVDEGRHTTEQNITTVEDGHTTADGGETHTESRREIQTQQHSKLINLLAAEHILQIRESSGHEEQHSQSFHETL